MGPRAGARLLTLALLSVLSLPAPTGGSAALDLARAAGAVRAFLDVAARGNATGNGQGLDLTPAAEALAATGNALPRWAILHAVAEEHERLSWLDNGLGTWHRARAACLYAMALESPTLGALPPREFAEVLGGAARVVGTLRNRRHGSSGAGDRGSHVGPEEALAAQEKQCGATMVEYKRWKEKRGSVAEFAKRSSFWGIREEHLDTLPRLWQGFSPAGAGRALEEQAPPSIEFDLRKTIAAVDAWRASGAVVAGDSAARMQWWDAVMRGCAVDNLYRRAGNACPEDAKQMLEVDLDTMKARVNNMHLCLNAAAFPLALSSQSRGGPILQSRGGSKSTRGGPVQDATGGALPVWIRVCTRVDPLERVLAQLSKVRGIERGVLVVSIDRDEMEGVLRLLLAVDFMQVRVYMHPFTETRTGLGFGDWDTGVHRLNSHYIFGLRLTLEAMNFRYVITLEDDLLPAPDFYEFHENLWPLADSDESVAGLLSYPNGPEHDCHSIGDKMQGAGTCRGTDFSALYSQDFFAGWGAGIPRRTMLRFLPVWNYSGIYDGILNGLLDDDASGFRCLVPCRPRVRLVPNAGLHGESEGRWDDAFAVENASSVTAETRSYHIVDLGPRDPADKAKKGAQRGGRGVEALPALLSSAMFARGASRDVCQGVGSRKSAEARLAEGGGRSGAGKPYTVWSSDFHIGPIADLKDIWKGIRVHGRPVQVLDYSLSSACASMHTCANDLKVLNGSNGQDLGSDPEKLKREFYAAYKDDVTMQGVDAFVCSHPAAMCELFAPFNKPRIVFATTRFEMARCFTDANPEGCAHNPTKWRAWLEHLKGMAASPRDLVLANNEYDAQYMAYFLGRKVEAVSSLCDKGISWMPSRPDILLSMPQAIENALRPALEEAKEALGAALAGRLRFTHIRRLYPRYEYSDLAAHPAIVLIPYQVSIMSFFEQYRLNIPLLLPSRRLLAEWAVAFGVVPHRTWAGAFDQCPVGSSIPGHPNASSLGLRFDPNDDSDQEAVFDWLQYADFYTFPHILEWDSIPDLVRLASLPLEELARTSNAMRRYNLKQGKRVREQWTALLEHVLPP